MTLNRMNPGNPGTQLDADTLYKLLALIVRKYAPEGGSFSITTDDMRYNDGLVLATHIHTDSVEFYLVDPSKAEAVARAAGGLPQ